MFRVVMKVSIGGDRVDGYTWLLRAAGYDVVWLSGAYCRACIEGRDLLFRWNGDDWVVV